jgi:tryptophanyl-tRNA synthetase
MNYFAFKKIMSAQTDSEACIRFDEETKPGVSNLLTIYSVFTGESVEDIVKKYEGGGYGDLKKALAEILVEKITVIQDKYQAIMASGIIDDVLDSGRDFTNAIAKEKYEIIRKVVGYGRI